MDNNQDPYQSPYQDNTGQQYGQQPQYEPQYDNQYSQPQYDQSYPQYNDYQNEQPIYSQEPIFSPNPAYQQEQPQYRQPPYNQNPYGKEYTNGDIREFVQASESGNENEGKTFGIFSIICSVIPIAGIILGIIGHGQSKKNKNNSTPATLNIVGIVLSIFFFCVYICVFFLMLFNPSKKEEKTTEEYTASPFTTEATTEIMTEVTTEAVTETTTEAATESTTEAVTEATTETVTEATTAAAAPTSDLFSETFELDGKTLHLPFAYSELSSDYYYDMSEYGKDDSYVLNPKGKTSSTIALHKDGMDDRFNFWIGFENNSDQILELKDTDVWAVYFDRSVCKTENYPSVVMPGGITWGSSYDDIIAAYGEPSEEPYYSESFKYWTLYYNDDSYDCKVKFDVYEDKGLTMISYQSYKND